MAVHKIKKGLDLPMLGAPAQGAIESASPVTQVAVVAADYVGMKPTMLVQPGDVVKRGQPLFEDKKSPGTFYTSPGAGTVAAVNRGDKRALQSVVVTLSDSERSGNPTDGEVARFESYLGRGADELDRDEVQSLLIESGLWTALRQRPFGRVPRVGTTPNAVFVTAMDSHPHAPKVDLIYEGREDDFAVGLKILGKLSDGPTYVCKAPNSKISAGDSGAKEETFTGPHPSGTPGVHIHTLYPVNRERVAWYVGLQDVIAIGHLFATGKIDVTRVVSLAGPSIENPRLVRTRVGASLDEIVKGETKDEEFRIVSGSVLSGRSAQGKFLGYLGRYHQQVSVLAEGGQREMFGWLMPGAEKFSVMNVFASKLTPKKRFAFSTSTNGSPRTMVPIGMYERVMPMDILPTFLLRSLVVGDLETAEKLGVLELDEEDLSLCTFVCPGKSEYGPYLRDILTQIELEG